MRMNSDAKIMGENVVLVPYKKHHVPKYHEWMKSEELQLLTASEALTLEEEYQMQESWLQDDDKCTFIILDKEVFVKSNDEVGSMIGDTNIFLRRNNDRITGEIEIMIAERESRRKKLGWESVILMFLYGINNIKLTHFEAKIADANAASIEMFKKLKFTKVSYSDVFKEITLEKIVTKEWTEWLLTQFDFQVLFHKMT